MIVAQPVVRITDSTRVDQQPLGHITRRLQRVTRTICAPTDQRTHMVRQLFYQIPALVDRLNHLTASHPKDGPATAPFATVI